MEHKRGDKLYFTIGLVDKNNNPLDIDTSEMRCEMRNSVDKLIDEFTISKTEILGEYLFEAQGDPKKYPIATLYCDIEFNDGDEPSSDTFEITIIKDVTKPPESVS